MVGCRSLRMKKLSNNLKGIIYILSGMFVIAFHDISLKILSINISLFLIIFFRSVVAIIIIFLFLKFTNRPIVFKTHFPLLTLARCLLLFIGFSCFFIPLLSGLGIWCSILLSYGHSFVSLPFLT